MLELKNLLNENISYAIKRERSTFDELAEPLENSLILFGAGQLGRKILTGLRKKGIEPIAFSDNNPEKWGQIIDGLRVMSPQEAVQKYYNKAVFIVTIWSPGHSFVKTKNQLVSLGCLRVISFLALVWKFPDAFLPHYQFDLPSKILKHSDRIIKAFSLFRDDESCRQFISQMKYRLHLNFYALPKPLSDNQYFLSDIKFLRDELFIDCGAFKGDTINKYLNHTKGVFLKIVAYEPDPINYMYLQEYVAKLDTIFKRKIEIFNFAIGDKTCKVRFNALGVEGASISDNGSIEVDYVSLDEQLVDDIPTFIKFDIEGAEMKALIGTQNIIKKTEPLVTVCNYHLPDDLWQIPLYLNSLNSNYHFLFRTHGEDGLDTVIYAIPPHRLLYDKTS